MSRQAIPAAAILDHDEYLRTVVGTETIASQRLFMIAADLGRDAGGQWKVIDRTQAPSGAGFAMQNRRVVSRVMPEIYHQANLHRLTPFFQAMRLALVDAAPKTVEDPRVVVLSPGTHSETAFDQAFVASLLGFRCWRAATSPSATAGSGCGCSAGSSRSTSSCAGWTRPGWMRWNCGRDRGWA